MQREEEDQHHSERERRDRDSPERDPHGAEVEGGAPPHRRQHARRQGDREPHHARGQGQFQRDGQLLADDRRDALARPDGGPEVAPKGAAHPQRVLGEQRAVQPQLVPEPLLRLLLHLDAEHRVDRVAGGEVEERKDDDRHEEQDEQEGEDPSLEIADHPGMINGRPQPADASGPGTPREAAPQWGFLAAQFFVAVYGGYFGAGIGILMLAALGFMGLTNIHRMNGLKNWGALCINAVAVPVFAAGGIVHWPIALTMAVGGVLGGYAGSRLAQRVGQQGVRYAIVAIGLAAFVWLLLRRHGGA